MIQKAFRSIISISKWSLIALSIFPISTAHADSNPIITEPTDFWFSYNEPAHFVARTYQSFGYESDPQIWLYNSDTGEEIASNDDYYGLQSNIELDIPAGNYRLRVATCCGNPDGWNSGWGWNVQYELSFNGNPVNTTTTTEVTTSLPPEVSTTTTQPELPTTTSSTTTETPTTWVPTTTSTEPTTTSSTTVPQTTVPVTEVPTTEATTTTELPTTSTSVLETTSTTVAVTVAPSTMPTTTQPVGTVEVPQTSLTPTTSLSPFFPTPLTTLPNTTTTSLAPTTTVTTSIPDTEPPTTTTEPPSVVIPDNPTAEEVNQLADELASSITELSDEEITKLVESIDVSSLTEESISAVFSEEVLNELSDDQVTELIDAIAPSALSDEQAIALSEALTNAPDNVKQEFEQQVDVFGGKFDTYVPTGSAVSVGARRVLVAAAAASFAMPTPTPSSRKGK